MSVMLCLIVVSVLVRTPYLHLFFFFNDTATTEIYTLSLHDALPISTALRCQGAGDSAKARVKTKKAPRPGQDALLCKESLGDRKSTRLNSSHSQISYAVFCLKKKKKMRYSEKWRQNVMSRGTAHVM